ncbi:MAG: DUF6174 domain-containing protein [Roseiflexaceae bacterium]
MAPARHRLFAWLAAGLLLLGLACAAGLWASALGLLPQQELARARWQALNIRHYSMTAKFALGWASNGPWTVEVRDEQVVSGYDTTSGAPLSHVQMRVAQLHLPVSIMFETIDKDLRSPAPTPRNLPTLLARVAPPLQRRLDRCAARLPEVSYDPALGYPSGITIYGSPCFPGGIQTLLVMSFTPLP